jgi:hypothetical protein
MHVTDRSKTVVMLIDWDNLQICHSRDAPGTELDLQALIALAQSYGTLVSARAYAEWNLLSERLAVYKAGIEPVFAPVMRPEGSPREGKSLADTVMVADGVDLLWTVAPDVFVLATSDKDMIPLARIAKQRGAAVVVLGSDLTAIPLVEMSNVFITYRQLLRELDRVTELEAPVGRAPARERRLRESRRPSSEPYGTGLGNAGGFGGGQLGSSGRGGPRPVGTMGGAPAAPAVPLPGPVGPRRRLQEPLAPPLAAPIEPERPFAAPIEAPFAEEAAEPLGIGNADVAPRRRRRRGGRGRRSGIGGLGDADGQTETLHDSVDEVDESDADEDERGPVGVASSSPDDIDSAVLQLLAARDREQSPPPAADTASEADAPAVVPASAEAASVTAPAEPAPPAQPRRVVRTSFSSFGPPDVNLRPLTPTPLRSEPATTDKAPAPSESEPESVGSSELASPADEPAPSVTDHAAEVTTEAASAETTVSEATAPEPIASVSASDALAEGATDAVNGTAEPDATPAASARPSRSSRSSRTGTSRRSRGSGSSAASSASTDTAPAEGSTEASTEGSADAARAPRRRRTRRPTAASSESAGEPIASEPIASEAGA